MRILRSLRFICLFCGPLAAGSAPATAVVMAQSATTGAKPAPFDAAKSGRPHLRPQFSIVITSSQDTLASGANLTVTAMLKNKSAYSINSGEDCSVELLVRDADGDPVLLTEKWLQQRRHPDLRLIAVTIKPGETQTCVFVLSDMYEIPRPGEYSIEAKRRDFWGTEVKSNILRVKVLPPYGAGVPSTPPPPKPTFSLAISAPQPELQVGSDLILKVALTNISDHAIKLKTDEATYWTDVRDEKGQPAPQTKYGHLLTGDQFSFPAPKESSFLVLVKRGETAEAQLDVTKLFDLSQPGKYTIQVDESDPESKAWVQSNAIAVTVIQARSVSAGALPAETGAGAARPTTTTSYATPPVSIILSTRQTAVRAGAGIWVDAVTTNLSGHNIAIGFLPGP